MRGLSYFSGGGAGRERFFVHSKIKKRVMKIRAYIKDLEEGRLEKRNMESIHHLSVCVCVCVRVALSYSADWAPNV